MKTNELLVGCLTLILGLVNVAYAVQLLDGRYTVELYAQYAESGLRSPDHMAFDDEGNLYITHGPGREIWRVDPNGDAIRFYTSSSYMRGIIWTGGTDYGGYLYVVGSTGDKIYRIEKNSTGSAFVSIGEPFPIAIDRAGNYGGYLYTATTGQDHTYRISTGGSISQFSVFPGWKDGGGPGDITFDEQGQNYAGLMYMTVNFIGRHESSSGLFSLDTSGNPSRFTSLMRAARVDIDKSGNFNSLMFVIGRPQYEGINSLWKVEPDGSVTEFAVKTEDSMNDLIFGTDGAMYIAEYNETAEAAVISRISAGQLVEVQIEGPNEVAEESSVQYKAIAVYDNNSTKDVTDESIWTVMPDDYAEIDNTGLLSTDELVMPAEEVTIYAQYAEGNDVLQAEKDVQIFALCPQGSALEFDDVDDYVEAEDTASLGFNQYDSFTIQLWAKPEKGGYLVCKMRGLRQRGVFGYEGIWSNDRFEFCCEKSFYKNVTLFTPENSAPSGKWHNVAFVYDNKEMLIYVNGNLSAQRIFDQDTGTSRPDKKLSLGARSYDSTFEGYFGGLIDEVTIYNRALTQEQVQQAVLVPVDKSDPNLIAYWDFEEGQGQIAHDSSVYGNNSYLGSDPCNPDSADPCWVEPGAPIPCTLEGFVEKHLDKAMQSKINILEELSNAIEHEWTAQNALEVYFDNRDFGDSSKSDVVKAKQRIHQAIGNEEQAEDSVEKSIEDLHDSMDSLGIE